MASKTRITEDLPGASPAVCERHVAAAFAFEQLEQQMATMAGWLRDTPDAKRQLFAVMGTAELAQELVRRLMAMGIALAGEL